MDVDLSLENFTACLNQQFALQHEGSLLLLELFQVDALEQADTVNDRKAFSILLSCDATTPLEQNIYHLENPTLGQLNIFIVPIGIMGKHIHYEAVFS